MAAGSGQALSSLLTPGAPGPEQQDIPLTEEERRLLVRLLSDPTYFPVEFRTWIRTYLESSDIRLPSSAIVGGNAPRVNLPAGVILPYAGGTIPSNCYLCDGSAKDRLDDALLFEAIGVLWGAGNGTSTFNIPDLRDRSLYGAGSQVGMAGTDGVANGSRGGPRHHHDINQTTGGGGSHSHSLSGASAASVADHSHVPLTSQFAVFSGGTAALGSGGSNRNLVAGGDSQTQAGGGHSHSVSGGTDNPGNHTHNLAGPTSGGFLSDRASFAGVQYIIATGKNV